jgi:hypothetical protein
MFCTSNEMYMSVGDFVENRSKKNNSGTLDTGISSLSYI